MNKCTWCFIQYMCNVKILSFICPWTMLTEQTTCRGSLFSEHWSRIYEWQCLDITHTYPIKTMKRLIFAVWSSNDYKGSRCCKLSGSHGVKWIPHCTIWFWQFVGFFVVVIDQCVECKRGELGFFHLKGKTDSSSDQCYLLNNCTNLMFVW